MSETHLDLAQEVHRTLPECLSSSFPFNSNVLKPMGCRLYYHAISSKTSTRENMRMHNLASGWGPGEWVGQVEIARWTFIHGRPSS